MSFAPSSVGAGILDVGAKGYVETFFYPPHNEYDPDSGVSELSVSYQKRTVARYEVELNWEFWFKDVPWLFFFTDDKAYFGSSLAHIDYNYGADPIVMDAEYGVGIKAFGV